MRDTGNPLRRHQDFSGDADSTRPDGQGVPWEERYGL